MLSEPLSVSFDQLGDAVWHADKLARAAGLTVATGHAALDAELPGAGWPLGAVCEILQRQGEHSEWRLLLPALRPAAAAPSRPGTVVLVGAPHVPFGPGLAVQGLDARRLLMVLATASLESLWATEQSLRCAAVAAVLAWLPQTRADQLRRLQMAAQANRKLLFVMRPAQARAESSPAALRLLITVEPQSDALALHILKRRGPPLAQPLLLPARAARLSAMLASGLLQGERDALGGTESAA